MEPHPDLSLVSAALRWGATQLAWLTPSPELDARVLLAHILGVAPLNVIMRYHDSLATELQAAYVSLIERRMKSEPVAYLCGKKEFFGLDFKVNQQVLIPRPDTELLIERALQVVEKRELKEVRILELGVGSGCISITITHELKKKGVVVSLVGVDLSAAALSVAQENVEALGCSAEITLKVSDWFDALTSDQKHFDLIVSNPPYIAENDSKVSADTAFEPKSALYSGADGLDALRKILGRIEEFLAPQGSFLCEIGYAQMPLVTALVDTLKSQNNLGRRKLTFFKDLAGHVRLFELAAHTK